MHSKKKNTIHKKSGLQLAPFLIKRLLLATIFLGLFFLSTSDIIKAQVASIIGEDGDGIVGITSLMNATINDDAQAVKFFSKSGSTIINQKNIGGASALHIAARRGNVEIAKILIENGADVNISDNEGWTPLMRAASSKNIDLVRLLMSNGADPRKMNSVLETVIVSATSSGCSVCLEYILSSYNFAENFNVDVLKKQLKDSLIIANNKNDVETESVIKEYLKTEVNNNALYSLINSDNNNHSQVSNIPEITPKTDFSDGIVKVKNLDNNNNMSYKKANNSVYKFVSEEDKYIAEPLPNKIPTKSYNFKTGTEYKYQPVFIPSNSKVHNKKFIFNGDKKPYIHQKHLKGAIYNFKSQPQLQQSSKSSIAENIKNDKKKTNDINKDSSINIYKITDPADVKTYNSTPKDKEENLDGTNVKNIPVKKFIFNGDKKPYLKPNNSNQNLETKVYKFSTKSTKDINNSTQEGNISKEDNRASKDNSTSPDVLDKDNKQEGSGSKYHFLGKKSEVRKL